MSVQLSRKAYAKKYGPTVGDRIRLADSELVIEIEHDYAHYGDEAIFGGGKSIRDGQAQCPFDEPMSPRALRPGHHQRGDHRSLGNRQGRYRYS